MTMLMFVRASVLVVAVATQHVAGGVNFDELTYPSGPCYTDTSHMHGGHYTDPGKTNQAGTDLDAVVEEVDAGVSGGAQLALVILECDFPKGWNAQARVYRVAGGKAIALKQVAAFDESQSYLTGGGPLPSGGWIHVSFSGGKLYVDVWNKGTTWTVTTYAWRGGALVQLYRQVHQRRG
jgi:hypothetical protein